MDPAIVLAALAELTPDDPDRVLALDALGDQAPVWLRDPRQVPSGRASRRLAAVDTLHHRERLLRRGWVLLWGTAEVDGVKRRVRLPLLTEPVRLKAAGDGYRVVPAGDLRLTPAVTDRHEAAGLESADGVGTAYWLTRSDTFDWIKTAAAGAGLAVTGFRHPPRSPAEDWLAAEGNELVAVVGAVVYAARDVYSGSLRDSLLSWAGRPGLSTTSLGAIYGSGLRPDGGNAGGDGGGPVLSPLPLTTAQAEVVRRARTEQVAVVSGPPGSGKSHAVVAAALEVVDRGGSVLVATRSAPAAEVLVELLGRYPGPAPVVFGDAEHRQAAADEVADRLEVVYSARTLFADRVAVQEASAQVGRLAAAIDAALDTERRVTELARWEPQLPGLRAAVPGAFAPDVDLSAAVALARRLDRPDRRRLRRLRSALGAGPEVSAAQLRAAVEAGRTSADAARLAAAGGTNLAADWQALQAAEAALAGAVGEAMRHRAAGGRRRDPAARRNVAQLVSALRAPRSQRRHLLARMAGRDLVRALPLWVGTAADVEDLLPPVPGLFDLVILDEASYLEQQPAALVLARARRALVVGDPRQLRQVSFVSDAAVSAALDRHGLDERVDVRRVSAFDLAAGAAPTTWLDEHFRSVPHLIEFSANRFYRGAGWGGGRGLWVATRHPRNDSRTAIEVVPVASLDEEVAAAVAQVRRLAEQQEQQERQDRQIAVVSPFRAHAAALETALLEAFPAADLARWRVRVGTVHGFQGSEAASVVVALGLRDQDAPGRVRFVADPHLFNVLVTRAAERMVVVTALTAADGIVGDYLEYARRGPIPPPDRGPDHPWTQALATELRRAGIAVRCGYPVGRWTVDLCFGDGMDAVGLTTRVHPDGGAAHRQRQRALARAGWRLVDAYPSRWNSDPVRAALDLSAGPARGGRASR